MGTSAGSIAMGRGCLLLALELLLPSKVHLATFEPREFPGTCLFEDLFATHAYASHVADAPDWKPGTMLTVTTAEMAPNASSSQPSVFTGAPTPYATAMTPTTSTEFFTVILGGLIPNALTARQIGMYWRSDIASTLGVAPDQVVVTDVHWAPQRPVHIYFSLFGAGATRTSELFAQIRGNKLNPVPENPVLNLWVRPGPGREARHNSHLTAMLVSVPVIGCVVLIGFVLWKMRQDKTTPRRMKLVPGNEFLKRRKTYNPHSYDPLSVPSHLIRPDNAEGVVDASQHQIGIDY